MLRTVESFKRDWPLNSKEDVDLLYVESSKWLINNGVYGAFEREANKLENVSVIGRTDKGSFKPYFVFLFVRNTQTLSTVSLIGQEINKSWSSGGRIVKTDEWANNHNFDCKLVQAIHSVSSDGINSEVFLVKGVRQFTVAFHSKTGLFVPEMSYSHDVLDYTNTVRIREEEISEKLAPALEKMVKQAGFTPRK